MQARRRWPASEPPPRVSSTTCTRAPDATARSPTEKPSLISTTVAGTSTATHSNRVRLDVTRSHTCSAARGLHDVVQDYFRIILAVGPSERPVYSRPPGLQSRCVV